MIIIRLKNDLMHHALLSNVRKLLNLRTLLHFFVVLIQIKVICSLGIQSGAECM